MFTGYQSAREGANANWNDRRQATVVTNVLSPNREERQQEDRRQNSEVKKKTRGRAGRPYARISGVAFRTAHEPTKESPGEKA